MTIHITKATGPVTKALKESFDPKENKVMRVYLLHGFHPHEWDDVIAVFLTEEGVKKALVDKIDDKRCTLENVEENKKYNFNCRGLYYESMEVSE